MEPVSNLSIDLSEEELQIFLAEADEQLQTLEEGLLRLERDQEDPQLIQALFRAAHTLKGSSGMIDHKQMVQLTHSLENALDAVRKGKLTVSKALTDLGLEIVDVLHMLRDQIANAADVANTSDLQVEIGVLTHRLNELVETPAQVGKANGKMAAKPAAKKPKPAVVEPQAAAIPEVTQPAVAVNPPVEIKVAISPDSIASAARAFQIMMALQEMGEIVSMSPSQGEIETAKPVQTFSASLHTACSAEVIRQTLSTISEIGQIEIVDPQAAQIAIGDEVQTDEETQEPELEIETARLGEFLVAKGYISQAQLQAALQQQTLQPGSKLGRILVMLGYMTPDSLDAAIARQVETLQLALRSSQSGLDSRQRSTDKTVRTSVERLDTLMNLMGELITDRNRLLQLRSDLERSYHGDEQLEKLTETIGHLGRITDQLQEQVMGIRMVPISNVFNKFPRLVRDLANKLDKQIDLIISGEDTELDRSVIEKINDPLIHLIRNAVDHGIEPRDERIAAGKSPNGVVHLTARHESGQIVITIQDDGAGIDLEKVKSSAVRKGIITEAEAAQLADHDAIDLIFRSGLSTSRSVSEVSGRGVGMDIVRNNIESLNGAVMVDTWHGKGTQFQIILPLTLAIVPTLLVQIGSGKTATKFAIPLVSVIETLRIPVDSIRTIHNRPAITLRGSVLPLIYLNQVLGLKPGDSQPKNIYIVTVRSGKAQMGLIVDRLIGEEEVMVKSLGVLSGKVLGVSGAAIMGDGRISLILDITALFKMVIG